MEITVYGCERDEALLFRRITPRFGVTPTITGAALSGHNTGLASGRRCISVGHKSPITAPLLLELRKYGVSYISTRSIGCDHIDVECAKSVGICVEDVAYPPDGVADYTLMLMLMAVRSAKSVISRADICDFRLDGVRGKELRDMTVGVIGTGRIGAAVAGRLSGFGCRVLAYDRFRRTDAEYVSLGDLLRRSDIVTLHMPLSAETFHILDRRRIESMKRGAIVINTGRGALIDTAALSSALESGALGGAALDVVEGEEGIFYFDHSDTPLESGFLPRLQKLPNVIITPHTAYYTARALSDSVENSIINCLKFEREAGRAGARAGGAVAVGNGEAGTEARGAKAGGDRSDRLKLYSVKRENCGEAPRMGACYEQA
jgi:D-specific alpha-keto acid dehydrogenase